ncbi:MAG TPA: hypothetical protein VGI05_24090, partial [Streptosporangiaceae bacterium]
MVGEHDAWLAVGRGGGARASRARPGQAVQAAGAAAAAAPADAADVISTDLLLAEVTGSAGTLAGIAATADL